MAITERPNAIPHIGGKPQRTDALSRMLDVMERELVPDDAPEPDWQDGPQNAYDWAHAYRFIDGQPFSLERFLPLIEPYQDDHPHMVIIKPAQRGVSEMAINKTMFTLDRGAPIWTEGRKNGLNVGYIFPTGGALGDFSKERIKGMEDESPYLHRLFKKQREYNAVTFKQIGKSYLYLRGGTEETNLLSFPADVIILDEYDHLGEDVPSAARRRMNASEIGREIDISTPTLPGFGIHAMWLLSDQRVYEQEHSCGAWVQYDFFRDVFVDGQEYLAWQRMNELDIQRAEIELRCPVCQEPVTEAERTVMGRWTAQQPEVTTLRGYWIPPLAFPVVRLRTLCLNAIKEKPTDIEQFYRSDLGQPYQTGGTRISREMLAALSAELENGLLPRHRWVKTTMGVDVGTRLHYRISSQSQDDGDIYVRAMGSVRDFDDLDGLMRTYKVRMALIDDLPEQRLSDAFVKRWKGRAAACLYPNANALKGVLFAPTRDKVIETGRVGANRTMLLDDVFDAVKGQHEHWPAAIHNDPEVIEHMTAPQRVTVLDSRGEPRMDWVHSAPDHGYHASGYDRLARQLLPKVSGIGTIGQGSARDSRIRR